MEENIMGKNTILIVSIISILSLIVFNNLPRNISIVPAPIYFSVFLSVIVLWVINVYFVFKDAKSRKKSPGFAGLTLLLGGIGGIIYYAVIFKEPVQNESSPS